MNSVKVCLRKLIARTKNYLSCSESFLIIRNRRGSYRLNSFAWRLFVRVFVEDASYNLFVVAEEVLLLRSPHSVHWVFCRLGSPLVYYKYCHKLLDIFLFPLIFTPSDVSNRKQSFKLSKVTYVPLVALPLSLSAVLCEHCLGAKLWLLVFPVQQLVHLHPVSQ